jgi:phospholipid/cholesterol/gamma-HCH transport system substrate-binding protein
MRSFRDHNPYLVGSVSILIIGAFTGMAFMVGLLNVLEQAYTMDGQFTDASGLKAGDDVRVAGVKVGRVTEIEADALSGLVNVVWVLDDGTEVHSGAGADIALATLLGSKYVRITQAMDGDQLLEDLPRELRTIPVERTTVPFDLFELTRIATDGINELDTEAVNDFITDLADITEGKSASVADLIDGITRVGRAINERDQELADLVDQADRLAGTLADKDDEMIKLIDASKEILDLVVRRRNELALVLGESADAVTELSRVISQNKTRLDSILDSLSPTLDVVAANQTDIDTALAWLGPGFLQQSKGGSHGPWQDIFVRSLGPDAIETFQDLYAGLLGADGAGE